MISTAMSTALSKNIATIRQTAGPIAVAVMCLNKCGWTCKEKVRPFMWKTDQGMEVDLRIVTPQTIKGAMQLRSLIHIRR